MELINTPKSMACNFTDSKSVSQLKQLLLDGHFDSLELSNV
jgi:hypothetical protein